MKKILNILAVIIVLASCTSAASPTGNLKQSDNYVVVLDLSDRLIQKADQVNIDTSAIRAVFEKFEKSVQRNIVVKSKDKFSIRIIPQKSSSLKCDVFENDLSIDMGKYSAADKLEKLNKFRITFSIQLRLLYQQALLGSNKKAYAGVDIWQYFNDQINSDLDIQYNNKVMIVTDGYFDFEDKLHGIKNQKQSTTTAPILLKMKNFNWKKDAEAKDLGIIPVKLTVPAKWLVCCIQPKLNCSDLLEAEKLGFLWIKWLNQSGANNVCNPILNSSSEKIKSLIAKIF
jgi:hypothetical protein